MWLSIALLLAMVLTLDSSWPSGHYGPPSTGRMQQLVYNTNHKQGATKLFILLNKFLQEAQLPQRNSASAAHMEGG